MSLAIADARSQWDHEGVYLNTASFGLPPRDGWDALQSALRDWRSGRTSWEGWGAAPDAARAVFARLVGVDPSRVAVGATVSELVGVVAASVPDGTRVLVPQEEFTSTLFPWLVQEPRGVRTTTVPSARLAEAIDAGTGWVAFSAVQMSTGERADLEAVLAAARHHGARVLCDATQAAGWLPLDASRFDVLVAGAYKWLMAPRGSVLATFADGLEHELVPHFAGWFAGEEVHRSYFGPPLRLAADARRLDTSPAWFSWVGTTPALELLERVGVDVVHEHDLALANRFRAGLGLAPGDSAIVSVDRPDAQRRLEAAGIVAAVRAGRLRTSWHLYNDEADVDRVLDVLA